MARGFNATLGGSGSDLITSSLATNSVLRSYWMHIYRRAGGTQIFWRQDNGTNINQCLY